MADSGAASPRRMERKTRSGSDLERDLEKVVSLVRKITWATFAETRRAALGSVFSFLYSSLIFFFFFYYEQGKGNGRCFYQSASLS